MDDISRSERHARGRLQDMARERGSSLAQLSRLIGRNAAYLQQYVTRGSPRHLDEPDLHKIAEFLGISPRVIATRQFDGSALQGTRQEEADWVDVPRLPLDASAGPGAIAAEEIPYDTFCFSRRWLDEQNLAPDLLSAITVIGDSMEPLIRASDEILVDRTPRPLRDGVYVVRLGEVLHVKRLQAGPPGRVTLISANEAYPPMEVALEDVDIIGRVVWKGGRL